jgi:ElaB/YqjD/DUF883 family membrane-anchored ribosome-binding protein
MFKRFSRPLSTITDSVSAKFQPVKKKVKDFVNETDLFSVGQLVVVVLGVVWTSGRLVGQFENLSKKLDRLDSDVKAMAKEMRNSTKEMKEMVDANAKEMRNSTKEMKEMVEANAKETRDKMEQDKCELIKKIDSKRGAFFLVRDYDFCLCVREVISWLVYLL